MSKIIVSKLQNGSGPELTLPTVDGIAGQVLSLGILNELTFKNITKVVSAPPSTGSQAEAGEVWINDQDGSLYYCVAVQTTPTYKSYWLGTGGFSVGFPQGQQLIEYAYDSTTTGTTTADYSFTVPEGVFTLSAVLVGAGGGGNYNWASSAGGGGALAWANDIAVTPGEILTVRLQPTLTPQSNNGSNTTLLRGSTVLFAAEGGRHGATSMTNIAKPIAGSVVPGNINSGRGGLCSSNGYGGGGGAGGYTGNGGNGYYGSTGNSSNTLNNSINGTGGAAAGGNGYGSSTYGFTGGGGVDLFGEGISGQGYPNNNGNSHYNDFTQYPTGGGSGGERGAPQGNSSITDTQSFGTAFSGVTRTTGGGTPTGTRTRYHSQGGMFGGGGGGSGTSNSSTSYFCTGGSGGARIIWGRGRAFPNTNTGDVTPSA